MRSILAASLVLAIACASGSTPGAPAKPQVSITQTSAVKPIRASMSTRVPVDFRLDVMNPLDHAVTLLAVEMETVGEAGGYHMPRVRHEFTQPIPAGATSSVELRAWVQPLQETDSGKVTTSVLLRGTARFDSMGETVQAGFSGRMKQ